MCNPDDNSLASKWFQEKGLLDRTAQKQNLGLTVTMEFSLQMVHLKSSTIDLYKFHGGGPGLDISANLMAREAGPVRTCVQMDPPEPYYGRKSIHK